MEFLDVLTYGIGARALPCFQVDYGVMDEMRICLVELPTLPDIIPAITMFHKIIVVVLHINTGTLATGVN